jgi:oxygen-dependent protoporphyrinogen oxidase
MSEIRVIGGGFTGTLAAYLLARRGERVTLVAREAGLGGMIHTRPHPLGDVETAANGFLSSPLLEQVADDIGVDLVEASPLARRRRYLWVPGAEGPSRWPLSMLQTLRTLFRGIRTRWSGGWRPRAGETVEEWGIRNLGRDATERVLATALLGIYASPVSALSATLVLGRFLDGAARKTGPTRLRGTVAPREGMGAWFAAMARWLERRGVTVVRDEAGALRAGHRPTVVCTGAPEAARLVADLAPELSRVLADVEMLPVVSVALFRPVSSTDRRGFGCLFHPDAGFTSLGVLFSSDVFPHRFGGGVRAETWILGGRGLSGLGALSDEALVRRVEADADRLGGARTTPDSSVVTRWPSAFPLYGVGLERALCALPPSPPGVLLAGNYLGALGLARLADRLARDLEGFRP